MKDRDSVIPGRSGVKQAPRTASGDGRTVGRVTLPRPVMQDFAYRIPDSLVERARPGVRVRVPFGPRTAIGVLRAVEPSDESTGKRRLRDIREVLDDEPVLDGELLELCAWIARYYVAPPGIVHRAALPPGMLTGGSGTKGRALTRKVVRLTAELPTLVEREAAFGRALRQRAAFDAVEAMGGTAALSHLTGTLGFGRSLVTGLVDRGLAEVVDEVVEREPFDAAAMVEPPPEELTPAQVQVLEGLRTRMTRPEPGVALLRGVTGSGKTVVYTSLIEEVLEEGRSALLLVPEIGLTPQTVARFRAVFGDGIAVLHSGLSDGERGDAWRALRAGRLRVAIGTRSAVFAPLRDLGLIVIDEEHDGSYKQNETPRYHARAVAAVRARSAGALLLLGSATPSLESWHNALEGRYDLFELDRRATAHPLPEVRLVDRRRSEDERAAVLSSEMREAISARLAAGRQAMLLLNRRGYSTLLQCYACGWLATCAACSVSLTWHRQRSRLVCHHCGWEEVPPRLCPHCGDEDIGMRGIGTEQVERILGETYPAARIARMDVDTTGGRWAHERILRQVRQGEVDILLGTQMIAKGLDLPGVTLVGVVDADIGLGMPDFRASERTFQLLAQVAGRAGRGDEAGDVIIQTLRPEHPALRHATEHDFVGFAALELADRAGPGYPPHVRLANLVISGEDPTEVADEAETLAAWLARAISAADLETRVRLVGPAPCPIERLRGRWRWHVLVKAERAGDLGSLLRYAARNAPLSHASRLEIDRDPESLL